MTEISLPPIAKNNTLVDKLCCDTLHKKRIYLSAHIVNIISQVNQLHEPNRSMKDGAINFAQDILQDIISLTRSKHNYINNFLGFERLGIIGSNYKHESLQRLKYCKVWSLLWKAISSTTEEDCKQEEGKKIISITQNSSQTAWETVFRIHIRC